MERSRKLTTLALVLIALLVAACDSSTAPRSSANIRRMEAPLRASLDTTWVYVCYPVAPSDTLLPPAQFCEWVPVVIRPGRS